MATILGMVSRSLRLCGVLEGGEPLPAEMAQDAVSALNSLLDYWNTQALMVYAIVRQVYAHLAGTASYALGPGATWDTGAGVPRPPTIERALYQDTTATPPFEDAYHLFTDQEYQGVVVKGLASDWPLGLYYSPTVPNGTVTLWPVPNAPGNTVLYFWQLFSAVDDIQASLTLATGYQAAIEYNLAEWLAPEYGVTLSPLVLGLARDTLASVQRLNLRVPQMTTDVPHRTGPGGYSDHIALLAGEA